MSDLSRSDLDAEGEEQIFRRINVKQLASRYERPSLINRDGTVRSPEASGPLHRGSARAAAYPAAGAVEPAPELKAAHELSTLQTQAVMPKFKIEHTQSQAPDLAVDGAVPAPEKVKLPESACITGDLAATTVAARYGAQYDEQSEDNSTVYTMDDAAIAHLAVVLPAPAQLIKMFADPRIVYTLVQRDGKPSLKMLQLSFFPREGLVTVLRKVVGEDAEYIGFGLADLAKYDSRSSCLEQLQRAKMLKFDDTALALLQRRPYSALVFRSAGGDASKSRKVRTLLLVFNSPKERDVLTMLVDRSAHLNRIAGLSVKHHEQSTV